MPDTATIRCGHVATDLGRVHYREAGQGAAVLLLHINRQSSETYVELIEALAYQCHAIALDYPGYGLSDHIGRQPTIDDYAACVRAVLAALGHRSAVLVGEAVGAAVAAAFAANYPESADAIILINTPLMSDRKDALQRIGSVRNAATLDDEPDPDDTLFLARYGKHAPLRPSKAWIERVRRAHRQCGADCWQAADALIAFDLRRALAAVRCPVLLLTGEFSPFADLAADLERCLPHAAREIVADARFGIGWEKAREVAGHTLAFAREHMASPY